MNLQENKEHNEQKEPQDNLNLSEKSFGKRMSNTLLNNKLSLILIVCLVVVFIWLTVQNRSQRKQFEQEKTELVAAHKQQLDSLRISQITFATEVFSWSVRSELLRNNTENLNQLLTMFVQQSGANLVQIINVQDNIILLSSDKKFEGIANENKNLINLSSTQVQREANTITIMSPIMGFNDKLGVLLVALQINSAENKEITTHLKEN
jgi:Ca2+/Na+ antiporter